jgi:hypothetical protein
MIPKQVGKPLVGLAGRETIEVVETHAGGPLIERASGADLKRGRIMILAEPRRGVAILSENCANGGLVLS